MFMKNLLILFCLLHSFNLFAAGRDRDAQTPRQDYHAHFNNLTEEDRAELMNRYRAERCVNRTGLMVSCGFRTEWRNGDPTYDWDPFMNQVPRGSQVFVDMTCNPDDGKFYMNVVVQSEVCTAARGARSERNCTTQNRYFQNPYSATAANQPVLTTQPTRWLASPGLYPDARTRMGEGQWVRNPQAAVTEYHRVSPNQEWEGAQMIYSIWTGTGSRGGEAIHGGVTDGYPQSRGCVRLEQINAFALYNLTRRVGTDNMRFRFNGYGPNRADGQPACSGPPGHRERVRSEWASVTREDRMRSLAELDRAFREQMAREGRVIVERNFEGEAPASTVMTPRYTPRERAPASAMAGQMCTPF
jgi:hypothetical protein